MTDPTPKQRVDGAPLRSPPRPVTRLNRRTLMILVGLGALVVLAATWWAFSPHSSERGSDADSGAAPQVSKAEGLARLPKDYSAWQVPRLGPAAGELGRPVLRAESDAGLYRDLNFRPDADEDHARVLRLRQQEEAEAATKGKILFQLNRAAMGEASVGLNPGADSTARENSLASLNALRSPTDDAPMSRQSEKERFMDRVGDRSTEATGTLRTPRSPFELLAGTVIPAALLTGIDSDLPGEVMASVTQSVYDTVSGRYLLIPQGSRLIGQYDSNVAYGQRRVLLVWTRLIMPDGSSIVLDRLPGMDTQGHAGLEDQVNWHWGRIFAGAAISTLLGINAQLATQNQNNGSVVVATRNSAQDTVNQMGQELTRRNLDVQPTLKIRPGYELRVMVNRDLILRDFSPNG